ncbi:caspase family protein [Novosphingobium sp.]|uniref:caspase family protein n=1 Tax=Novosphingobium sp. TaxID=1874826 RepID=UPI002622920A|nr:caspase family protein [Novosphingobium sp.]
MIRAFLALVLTLGATPASAGPTLRALFVGIDEYRNSRARVEGASFSDLRGAVADAALMKQALEIALKVRFDERGARCRTAGPASVTLTNACATRQAILEEWQNQIRASRPGDTVMFYFAGHGSTLEDENSDEDKPFDSTLLPYDARPTEGAPNDIVDDEIKLVIDAANARGVNVITVFDSCNSGTAARGLATGASRGVKGVQLKGLAAWKPSLAAIGPGGGYRVHFGAALDSETAREVKLGDTVHGVFTTTFAQALKERPQSTFGDLATAVRLKMEAGGNPSQHPRAEGQLAASFGGGVADAVLFDAVADDAGVELGAGRLLGMTVGSTFGLFDSQSAALAPSAEPLARATIETLGDGTARLRLVAPPGQPLPRRLVARELNHVFAAERLRIALREGVDPAESRLFAALSALPFVEARRRDEPAEYILLRYGGTQEGAVLLFAADGSGLANLGEVADPDFARRLRQALLTIYNTRRLLTLPTRSSAEAQVKFCLSDELDHALGSCPEASGNPRRVPVNKPVVLTLTNDADAARYIAVLVIDDRYGITQVIPTGHGRNDALPGGRRLRPPPFMLDTTGLYRFVIFSSDAPIDTAALEQAGLPKAGADLCDPTMRACPPAAGSARDGALPSLANWTITVEDAIITSMEKQ